MTTSIHKGRSRFADFDRMAKIFAEKFWVRLQVLPLPCGIAYEAGQT
jgi:hypothetical protein